MCQIAVEWPFDHLLPSQMRKVASLSAQPLSEPSTQRISRFLDAQRDAPFSYDEVGASRGDAKVPTGYAVDHNRVRLGEGRETFDRAVAALYAWKMSDLGWARVVPEGAQVEVGTTVAVLAKHY